MDRDDAIRKARASMALVRASAPESANALVVIATLVRKHSLEWQEYGDLGAIADKILTEQAHRPPTTQEWARKSAKKKKKFRG